MNTSKPSGPVEEHGALESLVGGLRMLFLLLPHLQAWNSDACMWYTLRAFPGHDVVCLGIRCTDVLC